MDITANDIEAEVRQGKIETMLLRGTTSPSRMAAAFGISVNVIMNDIQVVRKNWAEQRAEEQKSAQALRIRQFENVITMAYKELEKSMQTEVEITTVEKPCDYQGCENGTIRLKEDEKRICPNCDGDGTIKVETVKKKEKTGDPRYMKVILAAIQEIARIEGHYPDKSTTSIMTRTAFTELGPNNEIVQHIQELFMDAPIEKIAFLRAEMDKLRHMQAEKRQQIVIESEKLD